MVISKEISTSLAFIINESFRHGIFPEQLKLAVIVPLLKKGTKTDIGNYRPISLLSSISKIFEKSVHFLALNFLEKYSLLHTHQFVSGVKLARLKHSLVL